MAPSRSSGLICGSVLGQDTSDLQPSRSTGETPKKT